MHRPTPRTPIAAALSFAGVLAGCSGTHTTSGPLRDVFAPVDLPDVTSVRLGSGAPGEAYWQQRADYDLDVTLDAENRELSGTMVLNYTNNSPHQLDYLWFNLDQNLYTPDSRGIRTIKDGFSPRVGKLEEEGGYRFSGVRVNGETAELEVFDTIGRIKLDEPMQPAGDSAQSIEVEIEYAFKIQERPWRHGIREDGDGDTFQLAQWFPNICVYDDVNGWNTLPYLITGEFYTNYGDYRVSITVPWDHMVVCTGELANPEEVLTQEQRDRYARAMQSEETVVIRGEDEVNDPASRPVSEGTLTWEFKAEDVRSTAFASSPAFIIDAAIADRNKRRVLCQSAYPREAMPVWSDPARGSTQMTRHAINYYSEWLLEYPYPHATNVNGMEWGMEYPMIVFCGRRNRDTDGEFDAERSLFGVTDHEFGHQWFPMIVGSDERRYGWQDEGLNSFMNHYSELDYLEKIAARGEEAWVYNDTANGMIVNRENGKVQPIMTFADRVADRSFGYLAYGKPAKALRVLRDEVLGAERFDAAFRAYTERWAFKHPQPSDFFRTMEDVSGEDLTWFWQGWFYGNGSVDQAISRVVQGPHTPNDEDGDGEPDRAILPIGETYTRASITVEQLAPVVMPVKLWITYDSGEEEERVVPAEAFITSRSFDFGFDTKGRTVTRVEIDKHKALPDRRRGNNVWGK